MIGYVCDHCGWHGAKGDQFPHPRLGYEVCRVCWADGFETCPRAEWGPLMEAVLDPEPTPRVPKAMIDYTEEEWNTAAKIAMARAAHEVSQVRLKTRFKGAAQLGLGFMREEFTIAPRRKSR
jgi:hypothetical protein